MRDGNFLECKQDGIPIYRRNKYRLKSKYWNRDANWVINREQIEPYEIKYEIC